MRGTYLVAVLTGLAAGCGATASDTGAVGAHLAAMEQGIAAGELPQTTSILIARDGEILFEQYSGEGGPELLNDTWSVGKSVVSLAVGAALADGVIPSLDTPVFSLLADLEPIAHDGPEKRATTVRDLLTMSSPLDCLEMNPESPGAEPRMYETEDWIRWAVDLPVEQGAAGRWSYCTANVVLLARAIGKAAGEDFDTWVNRRLLDPLGIGRREWLRSPRGDVMGARVRLTTRGLAALGQLIVDRGIHDGVELVPGAYIDEALTIAHAGVLGQDYGFLFWRRDFPTACGVADIWRMSGFGGNAVAVDRARNAVIVITRTRFDAPTMYQETFDFLEKYALPVVLCG